MTKRVGLLQQLQDLSIRVELSAPNEMPLFPAAENQFSVSIDVYPQEQAGVEKPPAEALRIVQPNGSVDLWPPQPNGQQPPHSLLGYFARQAAFRQVASQ